MSPLQLILANHYNGQLWVQDINQSLFSTYSLERRYSKSGALAATNFSRDIEDLMSNGFYRVGDFYKRSDVGQQSVKYHIREEYKRDLNSVNSKCFWNWYQFKISSW